METEDGWGHSQGRRVHMSLLKIVEENPETTVFCISLEGVRRTDASFPRESVVELVRRFRGQKGFFLANVDDEDLLENWDAAARKREQPLLLRSGHNYRLLGPLPSEGTKLLFDFIAGKTGTNASEAAQELGLNVSNASNKLKALWDGGYILRNEQVAATGGIEFEYYAAR